MFASVAVTVYVPAVKPLFVVVVFPLLHNSVVGNVPPDTMMLMLPLLPPLQLMFVTVPVMLKGAVGWVITTSPVAIHPIASITVTVQVPAVKPVACAVVWAGKVFH